MILEEIKAKLEEIDTNVFYGMVDDSMRETLWNYIVFNRVRLSANANKTGFSDYYSVHIIRENWIPEGLDTEVINKMLEIDGMRLAGNEGTYNYILKPNTNTVVEMLSLDFVKARKKVIA